MISLKSFLRLPLAIAALSLGSILGTQGAPQPGALYQIGTLDGLFASLLEGEISLEQLETHGDFGIGTFHNLDGEMILLDGVCYQIDGKGVARRLPPDTLTPFATVCHFDRSAATPLEGLLPGSDYTQMLAQIDRALPSPNLFYAVLIEGSFQVMTTRSVFPQEKPYPGLARIVEEQTVFHFESIRGSLVGFRCPAYVRGINVPGWHFHFIDESRETGGHVLGLALGDVQASWISLNTWTVALPLNEAFLQAELGQPAKELLQAIATD